MTDLWEHQTEGVEMIDSQPATYLAWRMGAGKSRAIVEYVRVHQPGSTLILCPKSVVPVWPSQFAKHWPDGDVVVSCPQRGTVAKRLERAREMMADSGPSPFVLVLNYEAAWRKPMGDALLRPRWGLVVADEAHRAKAPGGKMSRWLGRLSAKAQKRVALSGTPMPHSPLDAYAQYRFLDPRIFGTSFVRFRARYAVLEPRCFDGQRTTRIVTGYRNLDELREKFYSIGHRVTEAQMEALPGQLHSERWIELPARAAKVYRELKRELIAEVDSGVVTVSNALVKCLRLQQICCGFVETEDGRLERLHDEKQKAMADILADIDPAEPVVAFCRFRRDLDAVHEVCARDARRPSVELSGRRKDIGARWEPQPGAVAAVQIQAGGVGIDLTAACNAVWYSHGWSLGDYEQAIARLDRPGQTRPVNYVHLMTTGTIEPTIVAAHRQRREVVELVLDSLRAAEPQLFMP